MIEIALCDDSTEDIAALKSHMERFAAKHAEFPVMFRAFTSSSELLSHLETNNGFDLYILDCIMPELSGIQLAEKIRSRRERAEIIFLTVSPEYAVDAFSVRASGYLLKPVQKEKFDEEVFRAVQKLTHEKNAVLTVKTKDGMRRVQLHKLVMIESFNHMRVLTMSDNSILETSTPLSELFDRLSEYENFYKPHRAYIVNLDYSMGITHYELLMIGNRQIPIPRKQFSAVQEIFSNYFFSRNNI